MRETPHSRPIASDELTSWKEIAAFLKVTVRTAQMWESVRGLPVRRLPGPRGRVSASISELEEWKQHAANPPEPPPPREKHRRRVVIGSAAIVVLLAAAGIAAVSRSAEPALFRIDQHSLMVSDESGRELWRKHFELLRPDMYQQAGHRRVWIGDLDEDGHAEVLFVPVTSGGSASPVICYDRDGRERWRFNPGRPVQTSAERFEGPYRTTAIEPVRLAGSGRRALLAVSNHHLYYPAQVALLSPGGGLLREYWHSGMLGFPVLRDIDGDGADEVVVSGIHNATGSATVLALSTAAMAGASAETDSRYQLQGFAPGVEVARVILPRTCINRAVSPYPWVEDVRSGVSELIVGVSQRLRQQHDGLVLYHFDRRLKLQSVVLASGYKNIHDELQRQGAIHHAFTEAEFAAMRDVTYLRHPAHVHQASATLPAALRK